MREIRTLRRDVEGAGNVVWSEHMAKSTRQSSTLRVSSKGWHVQQGSNLPG